MITIRRIRTLSLALAAGSVPFVLALSLHSQPAPSEPTSSASSSPRQVAEDLDAIMQPRFQDDRAGVFGMSRLVPVVSGHPAVNGFQPNSGVETQLWTRIHNARRLLYVGFLHCAHVPGKFVSASNSVSFHPSPVPLVPRLVQPYLDRLIDQTFSASVDWKDPSARAQFQAETQARQALFQQVAAEALPALRRGQGREKATQNWLVVMRPVRASKDSCLTCHAGAKRGDTLGVMVYAVSDTVNKN